MSLNLNFSKSPDYKLNSSLTDEIISIYGIKLKFVKVQRIGREKTFGDFSHLSADNKSVYDIYGLPDNTENFDVSQYAFGNYAFGSFDFISVYVSTKEFNDTVKLPLKEIVGNLIVLPNNKVLEITNVEWNVPHANNLFTYDDAKCVYKLSLRPYEFKSYDDLKPETLQNTSNFTTANEFEEQLKDIDETLQGSEPNPNYDALDDYFTRLAQKREDQRNDAEVKDYASTVKTNTDKTQEELKKPLYNSDEKDIWNGF
jgi:hypothetical protein